MSLTLYGIAVSSYVAKVRLALRLKGVAFEEVPPPGGYGSIAYRAIIAAGTVPAIVHDGFALSESSAILEYLEDSFPGTPLHPADIKLRATHRGIALYHDTKLEPAVRALFPLFTNPPSPEKLAEFRLVYEERLEKLAELVNPSPFLGGASIALGECGYPATLMMGYRILKALGAPPKEPGVISRWRQAFERHTVAAENTAYCESALDAWIAGKLAARS